MVYSKLKEDLMPKGASAVFLKTRQSLKSLCLMAMLP